MAEPTTSRGATPLYDSSWDLLGRLRRALAALALLFALGTALELATLRHWKGPLMWTPWVILALLTVGAVALLRAPTTTGAVRFARGVALVSLIGGTAGMIAHFHGNLETAPLAALWAKRWDGLSTPQQWWEVASGGAGVAPVLAPGFLAVGGAILALATYGVGRARGAASAQPRT
ncbi:MAG: hypothetical protein ABI746_08235 [Dermatophilaceae bacterium]